MLFLMILVFVTISSVPIFIPLIGKYFPKTSFGKAPSWLPCLAGSIFFLSFFVPNIHISNETETFQQHFIGGGVFCTILFFYLAGIFKIKYNLLLGLIYIFLFTSALGAANELLEFSLQKLGIFDISMKDTSWDLVANTSGAISSFIILFFPYKLILKKTSK